MATFRDSNGTDWKLTLSVGSIADAKRDTGINLALATKDTSWLEQIFSDPGKFVEVLWVLCEGQAKAANLSPEQFAHRFDGPTLESASEALLESIVDFSHRSKIATAIKKQLPRAMATAEEKAIQAIASLMDCEPAINSPESAA